MSLRVTFCGVRGSTPTPGPEYVRHGGHTSCVALARAGEAPSLALDAGTGLRRLSSLLGGAPFVGTILLGHLHWDHTHGIPFFGSGDQPGARVTVLGPAQHRGESLEAVLARAMAPPHFPITPAELRGEWRFEAIEPGDRCVEGYHVTVGEIPHKGGRTYGYRLSDGERIVAYLSDHAPQRLGPGSDGLGARHQTALALARDADLLIHDAQYTAEELPARGAFGHAAAEYAVELARAAGAARLALFHHDPARTDDEVDSITAAAVERAGGDVEVFAAVEDTTVDL